MNNTVKADGLCVKQPENAMLDGSRARKANKHLRLIQAPADCNTQSSKSTPRRPKNEDVRSREYLTEDEVIRLREDESGNGTYRRVGGTSEVRPSRRPGETR